MPLKEQVYLTLNGLLQEEYALSNVENLFAPDGRGYALYSEVLDAYASLCERLGTKETDTDVETIINNLLALCEEESYRITTMVQSSPAEKRKIATPALYLVQQTIKRDESQSTFVPFY